jgi:hypothetical protein
MSGLLDQIARRRRATASKRLGPQPTNGSQGQVTPPTSPGSAAPPPVQQTRPAPPPVNGSEPLAWLPATDVDVPPAEEKPWAWQTADPAQDQAEPLPPVQRWVPAPAAATHESEFEEDDGFDEEDGFEDVEPEFEPAPQVEPAPPVESPDDPIVGQPNGAASLTQGEWDQIVWHRVGRDEPLPEPQAEPAEEIEQPVATAVAEPPAESAPEPIIEEAIEASAGPLPEAALEPIAEIAPEPIPEPEAEIDPEPEAEIDREPVAEPEAEIDREPVAEVVSEPVAETLVERLPERIAPPAPARSRSRSGSTPDRAERGRMRRRVRYLRALREIQLRDIGGLALELHRFGRRRPELLEAKIAGAAITDTELRTLERVLDEGSSIRELREAGIGGACDNCGAVHGSTDRFCSTCGSSLDFSRYEDEHAGEVE